jgi:hypothetical protein
VVTRDLRWHGSQRKVFGSSFFRREAQFGLVDTAIAPSPMLAVTVAIKVRIFSRCLTKLVGECAYQALYISKIQNDAADEQASDGLWRIAYRLVALELDVALVDVPLQ